MRAGLQAEMGPEVRKERKSEAAGQVESQGLLKGKSGDHAQLKSFIAYTIIVK